MTTAAQRLCRCTEDPQCSSLYLIPPIKILHLKENTLIRLVDYIIHMKSNNNLIYPPINIHDVYQSRDLDCLHKFLNLIHLTSKPSFVSSSINRRDLFGRTLFHKLAASNQQSESIDWLKIISENHHLQINLPDLESGWTPLHRALYHGNLAFAKLLIEHFKCDLSIKDHEGLSAFELYMMTIGGPISSGSINHLSFEPNNGDLFTWGSNRNFLLGVHDDGDRHYPERIHLQRSNKFDNPVDQLSESIPFISNGVRFVAMSRLHTALITTEGELRVCGFGSGGRLGLASISHPNNKEDNLDQISAETQFTFAPVTGGDLANQRVNFVALGQDHTVVVTELGQVFTFGMNRFGQLGYAPESTSTSIESMIQIKPKRVAGLLKKVHVIGAAASRWHTAVFTSDSLYTWGNNRGQLGYPHSHPLHSSAPIQITPRKVPIAQTSIIQLSCMNYETAYLCDNSSEVFILKSGITLKVVFPLNRLPSGIQVSLFPAKSAKGKSRTARVVHINGSDNTLSVVSSMGDVYVVDLEQPNNSKNPIYHLSIPLDSHRSNVLGCHVPVFKPNRVWTSTKWTNAAKSAAVGIDGDLIVVTMSGDVHISCRRSGFLSKGPEIRSFEPSPSSTARKKYKFHKVPHLQQVSQVAASPSGSYAAIQDNIRLDTVSDTSPEVNITLPAMLATTLSHLEKPATLVPELHMIPSFQFSPKAASNNLFRTGHNSLRNTEDVLDADGDMLEEEEERDDLTWDIRVGSALVGLSLNWVDRRLSGSLEDGDIILVARSGERILAHRFILCSRSKNLDQIISGRITIDGISLQSDRTSDAAENESFFNLPMLSFDQHSLLTLLLLIHYLYTDHFPCLWDGRVWPQVEKMHKQFVSPTYKSDGTIDSISLLVNETKADLGNLAARLSLPALEQSLGRHGKSTPKPSLPHHFGVVLAGLGINHNLTARVNLHGNQNLQENFQDHLQLSNSPSLNPDVELEVKDGEVLECHSILMRAQCPFFRLMYDQGAWIKARRQSTKSFKKKNIIRFDMGHLTKSVMQVVLQHIYTDDADNLFLKKDFHSLNEFVDFVFDVMAVANELMMDKLKFICSVMLRRCVNLLNVTSIAAEAEYYRADSLKDICMKYMLYNLEGIFRDSKGLSNIPDDLLLALSNYLKKFQEITFPIPRSSQIIFELVKRHSEFLLQLDLPPCRSKLSPTSHHYKSLVNLSAASSQAVIAVDPFSKSSSDKIFTRGLIEMSYQQRNSTNFSLEDPSVSDSGAGIEKIDCEHLVPGFQITGDNAPLVIHDVGAEVGPTLKAEGKLRLDGLSVSDRPVWANPMKKVIPFDIRATMSMEKQRSLAGPSILPKDNLGLESPARLPPDCPTSTQKLSQREKRRQSAEASKFQLESPSLANRNSPSKLPAWRSIANGDRKITPVETDSNQALPALLSSNLPTSTKIIGANERDKTQIQIAACPGQVNFAKNSPKSLDPASAIGAAIITPTRISGKTTTTRQFSRRHLGGQETPWTNYATSCSNFIDPASLYLDDPESKSGLIAGSTSEVNNQVEGSMSKKPLPLSNHETQINSAVDVIAMRSESTTKPTNFSIIQDLQAKESWALYGPGRKINKPKLTQIQEEENRKVLEKKQEDQFLKWFEEESLKVQKQQQQEQQQRQFHAGLRSGKSNNKKSHIDQAGAHRGRRGNFSKINKEKSSGQPHLYQSSKPMDKSAEYNRHLSKIDNATSTSAKIHYPRTTQSKKKERPLIPSAEVGVKSFEPPEIAPEHTHSNPMTT